MAFKTEDLLAAILTLPKAEQLHLVEQVVHSVATEVDETSASAVIGLFEDDAELMDQVSDEAMRARERDPFRG